MLIQARQTLGLPQSGTRRNKLCDPEDPLGKLLDQFIAEQKQDNKLKTKYHSIHPRCLVSLADRYVPFTSSMIHLQTPASKLWIEQPVRANDPVTKELRKKIVYLTSMITAYSCISVLSDVSFICGYKKNTVIATLESICAVRLMQPF